MVFATASLDGLGQIVRLNFALSVLTDIATMERVFASQASRDRIVALENVPTIAMVTARASKDVATAVLVTEALLVKSKFVLTTAATTVIAIPESVSVFAREGSLV